MAAEDSKDGGGGGTGTVIIDELYEFSAPRFFDFIAGESEEEMKSAELWFDSALSYAPSPCMPKIKVGRDVVMEAMCDLTEGDQQPAVAEPVESKKEDSENNPLSEVKTDEPEQTVATETTCLVPGKKVSKYEMQICELKRDVGGSNELNGSTISVSLAVRDDAPVNDAETSLQTCTPIQSRMTSQKDAKNVTGVQVHTVQTAKKISTVILNPSTLRTKSQSRSTAQTKIKKTCGVKRDIAEKHSIAIANMGQENQAVKRQKLDEGRSRQILNVKPMNLLHKSRSGECNLQFSTAPLRKEDRKVYVRETTAPFVSMAEMIQKFQSRTRELSLPHDPATVFARKHKLVLTRPKEPQLETSLRARPQRIKSSAELEEEMMAKIPKFKARPVNKKILEAPTLPPLPRSKAQAPEFQEFHLQTMSRAIHHAETSSVASTECSRQNAQRKPHLTEPKTPQLQTSLRARPSKLKSSFELELEELQKIPKFKAKPLNKKIFESKGEMGIFSTVKKQVTIPEEFHFATDERITPANAVANIFDKLSICSESRHDNQTPLNTRPNPFHLQAEERGAEKEKKFVIEVMQKQMDEERARVPKANPYPYTTDFPAILSKSEPKQCTIPEPFELESLVRNEDELQREMEERQRLDKEEAEMRIFKAHPSLKDTGLIKEKARIPLTQVEGFKLQADNRALDRAESDMKIKKETIYKRCRYETEAEKMVEEEKALKHMRRTMDPQRSLKVPTKPKSPKLHIDRRIRTLRQKTGLRSGSVSSATSSSIR